MKDERKINKLIQEQDSKKREEILERLHAKHPELSAKPQKQSKGFSWQRFAVAACSVCLLVCAIVIPSVVLGGNSDLPINNDRFCTLEEYSQDYFDYTLKEYNQLQNKSVLHFDWYDTAYDCTTGYYFDIATNEVLGVFETVSIDEPDIRVDISAIYKNIRLAVINDEADLCDCDCEINGIAIKWTNRNKYSRCTFLYGDYRYIITLHFEPNETLLLELLEELLE